MSASWWHGNIRVAIAASVLSRGTFKSIRFLYSLWKLWMLHTKENVPYRPVLELELDYKDDGKNCSYLKIQMRFVFYTFTKPIMTLKYYLKKKNEFPLSTFFPAIRALQLHGKSPKSINTFFLKQTCSPTVEKCYIFKCLIDFDVRTSITTI